MKKVYVISDGRAGHYNQSLAVADALEKGGEVEVLYVEVKVRKFAKYLLRMLLNTRWGKYFFKRFPSSIWIDLCYSGYDPKERPDIVVSAGKDTSLLNALLALMYGSRNLFIGYPKKLDNRLFTAVLTVLDLGFGNQILLDVAPTRAYRGDLDAFVSKFHLDPEADHHTLLIGGDGSGYRYDEEDIDRLIAFVNGTSDKVKWLVTTSRRTPEAFERKMEREMKAACFIAYHKDPQKVVAGFLALSKTVFVTQESASMVSEGIAAGKPVVTLVPKVANPEENYRKILENFSARKRLCSVDISALSSMECKTEELTPLERGSVEEISEKLKGIL